MKIRDLRQKSEPELQKLLQDNCERLRGLRFNLASGKVKNVREVRQLKKDAARILTILGNYEKNTKIRKLGDQHMEN